MTDAIPLDREALKAAQIVAREGCGLTIDGKHVFCDDPAIGDQTDSYGEPLRCITCDCKTNAEQVITAYLRTAKGTEPVAWQGLSAETVELVDAFAVALKTKLRRAEIKYGYEAGWRVDDWEQDCRRDLSAHVLKGDPLDVAAYAAFCWFHHWSTVPVSPPKESGIDDVARIILSVSAVPYDEASSARRELARAAAQKVIGAISGAPLHQLYAESPTSAEPITWQSDKLGAWLSAALDDPGVADEYKQAINDWFAAGQPVVAKD